MILDTSIIIDFIFEEEPASTELTKLLIQEDAKILVHQMAEVCDVAQRLHAPVESILQQTMIICEREEVQQSDIIAAAELKWAQREAGKKKFSLADAMMIAVAKRTGEKIVTKDGDFSEFDEAIILS